MNLGISIGGIKPTYQTKMFGGFGKISTPIEQAWGHYSIGVLHEKEEAATPFMILSNGVIERNMSSDARFSGNLGRVTIPTVPVLQPIEMKELAGVAKTTRDQIAAFLDKDNDPVKTLIFDTHKYMNITNEKTGEEPFGNPTAQDFFVQTWPRLTTKGIIGFKDLYYRYYIARKPALIEICNDLQAEVTDIVRTTKGAPRLAKVGYGVYAKTEEGLKLMRRPSRYTRFNVNVARLDITVDPFMNTPLRMQAAYIWLLATQLKNMMKYAYPDGAGEGIMGYTDADYCGLANSLLLQMSGSGDIKIEKTYTATDIVEQMLHTIGMDIAEAYPFLPNSDEAWEEMMEFWLVLALVSARAKATTLMGELNLHSARNAIRAPYDFERYTVPNLPNFGSLGTPYYFMARNQWMANIALPTVMRYDKYEDEEFGIKGDAMDEPNAYDILMQKNPIAFTTADVSRGEVGGNVLDPLKDDIYVKLSIHPDTRIWDVEYSMNAVRLYRFPAFTILPGSDKLPERLRMQLYLINLFTNGKQNLKEGYFMAPGMGLWNVSAVKSYLNNIGQEIVEKTDTRSTQPQMSSPNTVIPNKNPSAGQAPESVKETVAAPMSPTEKAGIINMTKSEQEAMTAETSK